MILHELGVKYKTDKAGHGFLDMYEKYFDDFRDDAKKILEIGIWEGASLKMWKDYFKNAVIYGIDYCCLYEEERIKSFKADQSNREQLGEFIKRYGEDFDLIVDDGGHDPNQQQISFGFLFQYLKPKGIYVIEDLQISLLKDGYNSTLNTLTRFNTIGKFESVFLTKEENKYLEDNIKYCKFSKPYAKNNYMTSIIKKI